MNTLVYIETQRLLIRQYTRNDVNELFEIMSNTKVHRYTKDKNHPWDRLKTEHCIRFFIDKNFTTLDCFHGAVIEKTGGKLIG